MAPTAIQCPVGGCQFVTPEFEVTDAMELLKIHSLQHSIQPPQVGGRYLNITRNFRSYLVLNSQCSLKQVSIINSAISTSVIFIYDLQEVKKKLAKKHSTVRE